MVGGSLLWMVDQGLLRAADGRPLWMVGGRLCVGVGRFPLPRAW
jgi:hypothetical protein